MSKLKHFKGPRTVISFFLLIMVCIAYFIEMSMTTLFNESLIKLAMNGVLVLSLIPMLNGGMGMNFGLPVGITSGLIGLCIGVNFKLSGLSGFIFCVACAVAVAILLGTVYGRVIVHLKGKEEIGSTFIGLSFIPIMNFFWTLAPFSNRQMLYPVGGKGLRPRIGLNPYFTGVLDNYWVLNIGAIEIPVGLLFFTGMIAIATVLVMKSRFGRGLYAIGENEEFAKASGLDIEKFKVKAVILSTVIAAAAICVYAQSYGILELYDAPLSMVYPAVSAILIGGASSKRGLVVHAVLGTYLLQSIYLLSVPIANQIMLPEISEIMRSIITNGIILYALIMCGGKRAYA